MKTTYCERNYTIPCNECSLCNYYRDCHNAKVGEGGVSMERCRAEDAERQAAGLTEDRYGNHYITRPEFAVAFGF